MNRLYNVLRDAWLQFQIKAPPFVQGRIIPRMHELKELTRLLTQARLPVYRWQGQGAEGPLTVSYAGLAYTKPFLQDLLFDRAPEERTIGRVPFWRYRELLDLEGDLIIVEAPKHLVNRLDSQSGIVVPEHVDHVLDVRGTWQDVRLCLHRTVRDNELRWVRKYGYEYDVSHDRRDFDTFYYQMYLPTMHSRHGALSSPMAADEVYHYYKEGWLFRVTREGKWVSGVVGYPRQKVIVAKAAGIIDADEQLLREGAGSTLYYAVIHWANQNAYQAVNFLGSGARLNGGLFRYKRKWGTTVRVPSDLHRRIWIKVNRATLAVRQFLKENPFIILDDQGELHGFVVVDDLDQISPKMREDWEKHYFTPGLSSLRVYSVDHLTDNASTTQRSPLIIPMPFDTN